MTKNNHTPTPDAKNPAERKFTFQEKLRINWLFIPAVVFVIAGIRMFTLTTGTQLLFTDSGRGSVYKYYWIWLLVGVLIAIGGTIMRPVMKKKLTGTASVSEHAPVNTEPAAEVPAQEAPAEAVTETPSTASAPVEAEPVAETAAEEASAETPAEVVSDETVSDDDATVL